MLKYRPLMLALGVTLLLSLAILGSLHGAYAQGEEMTELEPWQQAIVLIEADHLAGNLSEDEAAVLRYQATSDLTQLPAKYQPPIVVASGLPTETTEIEEGNDILGEMVASVFHDYERWRPATTQTILDQMEQRHAETTSSLNEMFTTTHFIVMWDSSGGANTPPGCTPGICPYAHTIAYLLESEWTRISDTFGYEMPEPAIPGVPEIKLKILADVEVCGFDPGRNAISSPYELQFIPTLNLRSANFRPLMAHELYHQMQWHYAGFDPRGCSREWISAWLWYHLDSKWLMEGSATWIEHEAHPTVARRNNSSYRTQIENYYALHTNDPLYLLDYPAVMFFKFLQDHAAPAAGYTPTRDVVRDVWDALRDDSERSTMAAMTSIIETELAPQHDTWEELFSDFAVANYQKDYPHAEIFNGLSVPRTILRPIANPQTPIASSVGNYIIGQAARYWEVLPTNLNIAGGEDATGATIELQFLAPCDDCALDILTYSATSATPTRATHLPGSWGEYESVLRLEEETLAADFGSPSGTITIALALSNASVAGLLDASYILTATDNPPIAPGVLTAVELEADEAIRLGWSPVHETDIRYNIYRSDAATITPTLLGSTITPTQLFTDDTIEPGVLYTYTVHALDTGDNEGPPVATTKRYCPDPQPLDVYYVIDASQSMGQSYDETTTKLDAARQAIIETNALLASFGNGSRVGIISFAAGNSGQGTPPRYGVYLDTWAHLTTDFAEANAALYYFGPAGGTPTALALSYGASEMMLENTAGRLPIVILLTDGVPTISDERFGFADEDVQEVSVKDADGNFLTSDEVRPLGMYYPINGKNAGEPLADVMDATLAARTNLPELTIHAVAIGGGFFNSSVVEYVAAFGGGAFADPDNTAALQEALIRAAAFSACDDGTPAP